MTQIQQLVQPTQETKKFGRYEAKEYIKLSDRETILFEDDVVYDVRDIFKKIWEIILIYHTSDEYDSDKFFYHIKDSTVRLARQDVYSLTIINQNPDKRQETRKFLEEILK